MSTRSVAVWITLFITSLAVADSGPPNLGEPVDPKSLSRLDYTIFPDGEGLPEGKGSVSLGMQVYEDHCVQCHGEGGSGGPNAPLVGGRGSLATQAPLKTVGSFWPYATTVFGYIRRAMPLPNPGGLSNRELYGVTAYLLYRNGLIEEDAVLSATSLPKVVMPNRDGFVWGEVGSVTDSSLASPP